MSNIERFEDLESWKKARELAQYVYMLTLKEKFSRDFTLVNQIRSSSGSGMDNISEGFGRGGNREFRQFLYISNGSLAETQSQLYRAHDREYISEDERKHGHDLAEQTMKLNNGMIRYLKSSAFQGNKFKP